MPCVRITVNQTVIAETRNRINAGITDAIQLIPGKKADSIMVIIDDSASIYFHQSEEIKSAYVEVNSLLRKDPSEYYPAITEKICALLSSELGIDGKNVYVRYLATSDWGWNGTNF